MAGPDAEMQGFVPDETRRPDMRMTPEDWHEVRTHHRTREEFIGLYNNKENLLSLKVRRHYYMQFIRWKLFGLFVMAAAALAILVAGSMGELHGRVYLTYAPVEANPASPPRGRTEFDLIGEDAHLWPTAFVIPLLPALYIIVLLIPDRLGVKTAQEMNFWQSGNVATNQYGLATHLESTRYNHWFDANLVYGASGLKHFFYGLSISLMAVLAGQLVGITDLIQLIGLFMSTLFGFMMLWLTEYYYGHDMQQAMRDVPRRDIGSGAEALTTFVDAAEKVVVKWMPFMFAMFSVAYPLITITVYFASLASHVEVKVEAATTYAFYIFMVVSIIFLLYAHHVRADFYGLIANYMSVELIMMIINILGFTTVSLLVAFKTRDDGFLYAIELAP